MKANRTLKFGDKTYMPGEDVPASALADRITGARQLLHAGWLSGDESELDDLRDGAAKKSTKKSTKKATKKAATSASTSSDSETTTTTSTSTTSTSTTAANSNDSESNDSD